jgi:hypothetical protein
MLCEPEFLADLNDQVRSEPTHVIRNTMTDFIILSETVDKYESTPKMSEAGPSKSQSWQANPSSERRVGPRLISLI